MAVAQVGLKRSYQEMRGYPPNPGSTPASRDRSPSRTPGGVNSASVVRAVFDTPTHHWIDQPRTVSFEPNASIVLLGVRGVGKSSLGIIAASAYNRRLVDCERAFLDATGSSTQAFRKSSSLTEYHEKHREILERTFDTYRKDAVIICSFSDLTPDGARLLREFAKDHPVIHVNRDARGIQSYLQVWAQERVRKLLCATGPILRSCANFEFFNWSEQSARNPSLSSDHGLLSTDAKSANGSFMTLKGVEREFLNQLRNILGDINHRSSHHSAYPLSQVPVEARMFTLCAVAHVDAVYGSTIDLDELQVGADAVELRVPPILDWSTSSTLETEATMLRIAEAYARLRRATILPVILTVSADEPESDETCTTSLLNYCFRLAPEYCTVNLSLPDTQLRSLVSNRGRTAVIASREFTERPAAGWEDPECIAQYERAAGLGCQIFKLTIPASRAADNFALEAFRQRVARLARPTFLIAYDTGPRGRTSMCFNKLLTPVEGPELNALEARDGDRRAAVTAKHVITALFATFLYEPMHFFIYGANVSYSLSPAMHNAAYKACGMPHRYFTHSSSNLEDFRRLARDHHFGGAAVVQPYKTGVMPMLDGLSPHARAIGAVNTIVPVRELDANGSIPSELVLLSQLNRSGPVQALYGQNTDWIGIRACLRRGLSPANTIRSHTTGLICGAGGQARSTVYSMLSLGVRNVFICNRTVQNAHALADRYNTLIQSRSISEIDPSNIMSTHVRVLGSFETPWPSDFRHPSLIVSTIPTQTAEDGVATNFTIPETWLQSPTGGVAIELAYKPMNTPIVRQMRAQAHRGWIFMNGFDVLPEQAFAQFELFTGRRAPRNLMRNEVVGRYREEWSRSHDGPHVDPLNFEGS